MVGTHTYRINLGTAIAISIDIGAEIVPDNTSRITLRTHGAEPEPRLLSGPLLLCSA